LSNPQADPRPEPGGLTRALDLAIATVLLLVLSPLLVLIALAVRISCGRPVLFVQMRLGRGGVPFPLH
jgi:lipopolysaccharide/colanic/teichoic acid biosynthesis glycosyltransferase